MLFSGKGREHLNGHKELTKNSGLLRLEAPSHVYIPLLNMGSSSFDVHVEVGQHVQRGQKIATRNDHFYLPIYASVSGTVVAIEKRFAMNLKKVDHIVIENDYKNDKAPFNYLLDLETATPAQIVNSIKELGLVGRGGSGFPTYVKYQNPVAVETILINGVECEPFITIDEAFMQEYTDELITGICFLIKAAGAKEGVIAFKKGKPHLKKMFDQKLQGYGNIRYVEVPDVYPMGWERTLVKEVFNKEYDRLPSEVGIVVDNSTTCISVGRGFMKGLKYNKGVTISGDGIKKPQNVIVPVGTTVSYIIEQLGGYVDGVDKTTRLVAGGPMMGGSQITDDVSITTYSNAITVLLDKKYQEIPCLRCGKCIDNCPTGLQPVQIKDCEIAKNSDGLKKLEALKCVECGLCSYTCPSRIEVTEYVRKGKRRLQAIK